MALRCDPLVRLDHGCHSPHEPSAPGLSVLVGAGLADGYDQVFARRSELLVSYREASPSSLR